MNGPKPRLLKAARAFLALAQSKGSFAETKSTIAVFVVLSIWLTVVIFAVTRHEFWRDEVRALSLARAASSPVDFYSLTKNEGHPVLWYLLLYVGKSLVDTPLVLPFTSIIIGFSAVAVFMLLSPFQFWLRSLFVFSALPLYEYSVIARNYGISMLLLFVGAVLYRKRLQYPWTLAFILALLANTNVHSAILTCLIAALWVSDTIADEGTVSLQKRRLSSCLPLTMVVAGVVLCLVWTMPRKNTIVTQVRHSVGMEEITSSFCNALLRGERTFSAILPAIVPTVVAAALLYLALFGLFRRPKLLLAAIGGQVAFGVLFRVVYPGDYRHQGLFLVFLVFLYWRFIETLDSDNKLGERNVLFSIGLYFAMVTLIVGNVAKAKQTLWRDFSGDLSSSKALGAFLGGSEAYRDAIIVPEPDYLLESLPYYTSNRIYLPRESRFGTTASNTTKAACCLSLGQLLSVARSLRSPSGPSVLLVLGHSDIDKNQSGERRFSYNKVFSWQAYESVEFNESTKPVHEFSSAYSDENYRVYAVR